MKTLLKSIILMLICFAVNAQNSSCDALLNAFKQNNTQKIISLIETEDVNCYSFLNGTPLILAVRYGDLEIIKTLVKVGADVNKGVVGDSSPLIAASRAGNLKIVAFLVQSGADVDLFVPGDETPLIGAAWNGHVAVVKYLVEHGAEVNKTVRNNYSLRSEKRNALRMAKKENHEEVVAYLISKGAKN